MTDDTRPTGIHIVDCLGSPVDYTAWRCATGDQENPPRLPLLCGISGDRTTLVAIDCLSDGGAPRVYRIPLPDHLRDHDLFSSIGHGLLLEKRGFLSGIHLFNPFAPPSSPTQVATLPPSASLLPHPSDPRYRRYCQIHTVVPDTKSRIALALVRNHELRLAYTMLDSSGAGCRWIDLTDQFSPVDLTAIFESALLYKDCLFCAMDVHGNRVLSFDLSCPPSVIIRDITFNLHNNTSSSKDFDADWCVYQSASIINSASSLFLVRWRNKLRRYGTEVRRERSKDGTEVDREIDVFRFDDCSEEWVPQSTLGDHSFFIARTRSFSISTVDYPELKSNRVYLCVDAIGRISGNQHNCPYDFENRDEFTYHLVYNLVDKSWDVFYADASHTHTEHPARLSVWMLPPAV